MGEGKQVEYIINPNDVAPIHLTGRKMSRLITSETVGAKNLTVLVIWVQPGEEVLPCHSHKAEEAAYIVQGEGEFWIDGQTGHFKSGDVIWFPYGSKHMIRNTSNEEVLQAVCMYSPPMHPDQYTLYEDIKFD